MPITLGRPKSRPKRVFWLRSGPNGELGELKVWLRHKAQKGFPEGDIVKVDFKNVKGVHHQWHMKIWEAAILASGLNMALSVWTSDEPELSKEKKDA